jgi:nicotinamide mononucleotide (NMN) deamidase PncC
MDPAVQQAVESIHATPERLVLAAAGGGSRAIAELLEVPGASRTILEVVVPYSEGAMVEFLGGLPDQFCSPQTARAMAMAAFCRARRYDTSGNPLLGVACTASLATDRPKRGAHRAHLAVQTEATTATWSLGLEKARRSRAEEEALVSRLLLNVVSASCGLAEPLSLELFEGEELSQDRVEPPPSWRELLLGHVEAVGQGQFPATVTPGARALFPGAFNPLHVGHRRMAQIASEMLGRPVEFELSVFNVDKPPLDYVQIRDRAAQFGPQELLWLTRLPTFDEKSRHFPGATFVVGTDTLARIADPRYYGSEDDCRRALERIASRGCRFLVFGRHFKGDYTPLNRLEIPELLRSICHEVPEEQFREDISSTDLRRSARR